MEIQLTTPQIIILFILWFVIGAALDFGKTLLTLTGQYLSFVPKEIKTTSSAARKNIKTDGSENTKIIVVSDFIEVIHDAFEQIKNSLLSWAMNFLRQVVERVSDHDDEEFLDSSHDNNFEGYSVFDNRPENKNAGQKIIGALLELIALIAFLYADACQAAQTYSVIFETARIPDELNNIIIPLIVASAGTAFILGIFIGDSLQLTHFGHWGNLKGKSKKAFFWVTVGNLAITITLAALVALYRSDVLGVQSENLKTIAVYAQSLVIVPMLITTTLLLRGAFGIFVILSVLLWLISIPFAFFEFIVDVFGKLVDLGIVSVDFVFSKIVWLILAGFELLFSLLEKTLQGSFLVIIALTTIVFYIPYLIINLTVEKISGGKRLRDYFENLEKINMEVSDENHT